MSVNDSFAVVAVIIALFSLHRIRKRMELEYKLNETTSTLKQLQLEIPQRKEEENNSDKIDVYFYLVDNGNYRVAIGNIGQAVAREVKFQLEDKKNKHPFSAWRIRRINTLFPHVKRQFRKDSEVISGFQPKQD